MRLGFGAAIAAVLVALSGCNITIPPGLLQGLTEGGGITTQGNDCRAQFDQDDANGDGALSETEYVQAQQRQRRGPATSAEVAQFQAAFKALDANGDGKVTLDEFLAQCRGTTPPKGEPSPLPTLPNRTMDGATCSALFDLYDGDRDGYWSKTEFESWYSKAPEAERSNCAMPAAARPIRVSPSPGGMAILNAPRPASEAMPACLAPTPAEAVFAAWDTNNDGRLSRLEFCLANGVAPPATPTPMPPIWQPTPTPAPTATPMPLSTIVPPVPSPPVIVPAPPSPPPTPTPAPSPLAVNF